MSKPIGYKKLWKYINWKNDDEKLAFFNHYFSKSNIVSGYLKSQVDSLKQRLVDFVRNGEIKDGDKIRKINNEDIIREITKR